ncbi:MAG TPA: hypothetical protein VL944_01220 [Candidatus Acidoferrum sp.]|nr:hypothetical protein [Candidatus Acidoferrum sp.]
MADEPNFLDLVALSKITPDLVVEKFGSKINSSFFDGSNILGTLRIKGLIDFTANFPGQSMITVTDAGKALLKEAADKAVLPFDQVDFSILMQLQTGKRSYVDIGTAVNLRPKDLAMHLYKLSQQQYAVDEIKNGQLDVMLTEKGLMQAKTGMAQQGGTTAPMQPQPPMQQQPAPAQEVMPGQEEQTLEEIEAKIRKSKGKKLKIILVVIVFIIIVFITLYTKGIVKI